MNRSEAARNDFRNMIREHFTNRPISITTKDRLWCIEGHHADGSGGGVLAWCYDELDAKHGLELFRATGDYEELSASKYK